MYEYKYTSRLNVQSKVQIYCNIIITFIMLQ